MSNSGESSNLRRAMRLAELYALVACLLYFAHPSALSVMVGAPIVALGEAIRFWSAGHLLKTEELVTCGPYRLTRNPLYLGRILIFTGLSVMVNLPYNLSIVVMILGWMLFFGIYMPRKERVEPARLRARHGEAFDRYFQAVPALFPTWRPYPHPSAGRWSLKRISRNREVLMVIGLALVIAYLAWRAQMFEV